MNSHTNLVPPDNRPIRGLLTIIYVTIKDAQKLYDTGNVDKYCKIEDNMRNSSNPPISEFTSMVFPSSVVLWLVGFQKKKDNEGFGLTLDLTQMKPEDPPSKIFGGSMLIGSGRGILAWTNPTIPPNTDEKYNLWFSLTDRRGIEKQFCIDPHLKGNANYYYYLINFIRGLGLPEELADQLVQVVEQYIKDNKIDPQK